MQRDDDGRQIGHVAIYPRAGTRPAATRTLVEKAGELLDQATADGDARDNSPPPPQGE
ncbi:hypothetical protein [Mycobacterium sherrisii]|uniref:hypothetical protein n=1 Tax=Mycobacterium sherrisii TaxID=243061 RepID=UPI0012F4FAA2|nr:hypothetical protein [Mycobacterium sherrisii]